MELHFDCLEAHFKTPFGPVGQNEVCTFRVEVSEPVDRLWLVLDGESGYSLQAAFTHESETNGLHRYRTEVALPRRDLYFYYFRVDHAGVSRCWFRSGLRGTAPDRGERWQLTCCPAEYNVPDELAGAVMYQIFPDRFCKGKSTDTADKITPFWLHDRWGETPEYRPDAQGRILNNDFFGGNLDGIRQKLDYLKSLHVELIYLNPICMAWSNHRYDTADYRRVDPLLGTDEDLRALCREAHAHGMKVLLDGVFSHTGSDSVYFDRENRFGGGAYHDPASPYRAWYDFQHWPDRYTAWWGIDTLPCVNELEPSYLDFLIAGEDSVIAHWLSLGVDGFRLDVADELPDAFIAAFRARLKALKPDALLMGEVWEDASNKIAYSVRRRYFSDGELDSVMNYPFRSAILDFMARADSGAFQRTVLDIVEHYPAPVLHRVMNSLSTHDTPRILTLLGDEFNGSKAEKAERFLSPAAKPWAVAREMAAAVLQFTLPGMAAIYYGDEAGLEGFEDPFNRRCFPWGQEDQELLEFYRQLTGWKAGLPALRRGTLRFLPAPDGVLLLERELDGQRVLAAVNGRNDTVELPFSGEVLHLHYGRKNGAVLSLDTWASALVQCM